MPGTAVRRALQVLVLRCCSDPAAGRVSPGGLDHSSLQSEECGFRAGPLGWKSPGGRITPTPRNRHREGFWGRNGVVGRRGAELCKLKRPPSLTVTRKGFEFMLNLLLGL